MELPAWVSVTLSDPSWVREALIALAMPKSVTTAAPPESRMFSGLMSRWITPSPWAKASARATSRSRLTASPRGSRAPVASRARNDSPRTNGMV